LVNKSIALGWTIDDLLDADQPRWHVFSTATQRRPDTATFWRVGANRR
jgi:hypothetical protein